MRFRRHLGLERGLSLVSLVPLINTVLLLLVFFILSWSFLAQPGMKISLPKAVTSGMVRYDNIEITVSGENNIYLNGRRASLQELESLLRQIPRARQSVMIRASRDTSFSRITDIWNICRKSGVAQINIAANQ